MQIAIAQINSTLGDFASNKEKIIEFGTRAKESGCNLVIFPECALFGYHPFDLLERKSIVQTQLKEFEDLKRNMPDQIGFIFGMVTKNQTGSGKPFYNSAAFLEKKQKPIFFHKELLPTYDVFDEGRHFSSGDLSQNILKYKNHKILITICEDIWCWDSEISKYYSKNPIKKIKPYQVDFIINISASPFTLEKQNRRFIVAKKTAQYLKAPLVYVNLVGAQDELIFDGSSFALSKNGKLLAKSISFNEDLSLFNLAKGEGEFHPIELSQVESMRQALVLGIRDFCNKTGFKRAHLGLSGGIDSAVAACLMADALGPQNVSCICLPGPFSSDQSLILAKKLTSQIHSQWLEIDIREIYEVFLKVLSSQFDPFEFGVTHENLQARIRGIILMAFSNQTQSLLIATSNKDELATGYATLYGDMCGGLAPLGDLNKKHIYELAHHYNSQYELIPNEIIQRAPSAELRPHQKDSDTLPPYDQLDMIVENLVEKKKSSKEKTELKILESLMKAEHKRWQSPPILKITDHSFGRGRRMPIAHRVLS